MSFSASPAGGRRRSFLRRRPFVVVVTAVIVLAVPAILYALLQSGGEGGRAPVGVWQAGSSPTPASPAASPTPTTPPVPQEISLSATGDIIFGDAGSLPPNDGEGFFDGVTEALRADLVMGNLEQPLTDDTGVSKCGDSPNCFAFRAPPHYAGHLRDAGFQLMNTANNHGNDYGTAGRENTKAALEEYGIAHTGERDQITVVEVSGLSVAVLGFSSYEWTNSLIDLNQARDVVARAAEQADIVVVQAHMGAEGADQTRVRPGEEIYHGENRGDPMAFARAVIDAGADLVVGHGPHVLRGLEFYQGRLIAYSLGNFAGGGGTLRADGNLGLGAVLRVSVRPDGSFVEGQLISTHMYDAGLPKVDPEQRSLALVRDVTEKDFPATGARLGPNGEITPPAP